MAPPKFTPQEQQQTSIEVYAALPPIVRQHFDELNTIYPECFGMIKSVLTDQFKDIDFEQAFIIDQSTSKACTH